MPSFPNLPSLQCLSTLQGLDLNIQAVLHAVTQLDQAQHAASASQNLSNTTPMIYAKPAKQSQQSNKSRAPGTRKKKHCIVF